MKLAWLIAFVASVLMGQANAATTHWEQPAANLADQVAEILGPGQARLTIRNLSTVSTDEIPAIRRLLVQDLKTHGVIASGTDSANSIRVTLSENSHERVWIAEVVEGNETRVAMVEVEAGAPQQVREAIGLTLRKQVVLTTGDTVLALLETAGGLVAVEPEEIVLYARAEGGWQPMKRIGIGQKKPLPRDARAAIVPSEGGDGFTAFLAGMECSGSGLNASNWTVRCSESDDPWIIATPSTTGSIVGTTSADGIPIKAFYNALRDYFTGMVVPAQGPDLPPFYSGAILPRSNGTGWLVGGLDGKVQLAENGMLRPIAGTRDWGSDFATLHSGCGAGTQIVVSGSGVAMTDSLRAFELPAQETIPVSAPLAMDGTVTALWSAPDGKSVIAIVRGIDDRYEVDRVTALCN